MKFWNLLSYPMNSSKKLLLQLQTANFGSLVLDGTFINKVSGYDTQKKFYIDYTCLSGPWNQLTKAKSQEDFKEAQFTKGTRNTFLSLPQVCCL